MTKWAKVIVLGLFIGVVSQTVLRAESVLRVCDDVADPISLDPFLIFSEKTHIIIQQINETLVRLSPNGKLEPSLAESWERITDTQMRFHLRQDVKFHNGEPFDSNAVKFTLEHYVDPQTKYPGFGFVATISSVAVVDSHTIDIFTHIPDGLLLNRLAAFCQIVPPKYYSQVGPNGFSESPIGTGPFKFEKWEKGKSLTLSANRDYWMKGFPKLDKLVFKFIPALDQMQALIDGKVDLVTEFPGTMTLHVLEENPMLKIVKQYTYNTVTSSFNISKWPLSDIRIRKAINYALNKEEMIQYDLLTNGRAIATTTMPGEEGHNPTLQPYPYDLQKAKDLLREAAGDKDIVLNVIAKEQGRRTIGIVRSQLGDLGIKLNIQYTNDANFVKDIASKDWNLTFGNCPDPMGHSSFIQTIVFYSKSSYSLMRNPEYDRRLEEMITTIDPKKRSDLGMQLDKYIYDQALSMFTYQRLRTYGANRSVHFQPYVSGMPHFYSTYFGEPTKRVEMMD